MNKTIGYCSKTIGCTQKSGFLFAETRCNNQSFDKNIPDNNLFDKNIRDADSKKIIQHHFKVKQNMHGDYMSYVWRMWEKETFDVMINVKPCTITRQDHSLYLANQVKFLYGKKSCLFVRHLWFV